MKALCAGAGFVLVALALALPAHAGPGRGRSVHAPHSGGHHGARHSHAPRHYSAPRHHTPRVGIYLGAPVLATAYYAPRYHYHYPPAYLPQDPGVLYYCPAYGDYYPRVQSCPVPWQQVFQPPGAPPYPPYY